MGVSRCMGTCRCDLRLLASLPSSGKLKSVAVMHSVHESVCVCVFVCGAGKGYAQSVKVKVLYITYK